MNLPQVITKLIEAQNNFDSLAYADCFAETAVVFDEGRTHSGPAEIRRWIEEANQKYRSLMKPLDYTAEGNSGVLSAEVSGTFPQSPILLKFHFDMIGGKIQHLKVTG